MASDTLLLSCLILIAGCHTPVASPRGSAPQPSSPQKRTPASTGHQPVTTTGRIGKVLTIIEENHSLAQMRDGMPYLYGLARQYGYATHYRGLAHSSLPNYLAIAGGSTFGVHDDASPAAHPLHGPSVLGQAVAAGLGARLYAESMPAPCSTTAHGPFAVKHAPWPYFVD